MKLLRLFIFFILFSTCGISFAQTQILHANADYIKMDPYGNIYAIKEAQLSKFSPQGKLISSYSNNGLGVISSIDVFNPMKIMLFYQDAGVILFLNEQLSLINDPIYLHNINYFTISLASYSADNQIHIYDYANKYLITLDFFMRELSRTPVNFPAFNPIKMIELEEKNLALYDPNVGVFLFDIFCTYNKSIPITANTSVEVTSDLIYYTKDNDVVIYNYKTMDTEIQQIPVNNVLQTLLYRNKMILLLQNGTIWIYELKK